MDGHGGHPGSHSCFCWVFGIYKTSGEWKHPLSCCREQAQKLECVCPCVGTQRAELCVPVCVCVCRRVTCVDERWQTVHVGEKCVQVMRWFFLYLESVVRWKNEYCCKILIIIMLIIISQTFTMFPRGVKLGNKDMFSTCVKVKMWHATVYLWELADFSSLSKLILSDD